MLLFSDLSLILIRLSASNAPRFFVECLSLPRSREVERAVLGYFLSSSEVLFLNLFKVLFHLPVQ